MNVIRITPTTYLLKMVFLFGVIMDEVKKKNNWSRRNLLFLWNICWLWQPWKISLDSISLRMIILNYIKSFPPNDGSKDKKPKYKWIQIHKTFHNWFFATLFLIFSLIDLISICTYLIYNIWFATYVIICTNERSMYSYIYE